MRHLLLYYGSTRQPVPGAVLTRIMGNKDVVRRGGLHLVCPLFGHDIKVVDIMSELSRWKTIVLIVSLIVMWGICWPVYKLALAYTPPILFAGMRTLIGGLLTALVILPRYRQIRWKQNWPIYLISALFNAFLFYGLQTVGLRFVPEGLFTVIVYLQPVLVGLLAWLWLGQRLSAKKMVGLLLGVVGVGVISVTGLSGHISAIGIVLAVATAVSWAIGTVYVKKVGNHVDALWLVAFQCSIAGAAMTAIGFRVERWSSIVWNAPYLTGLIFGAVFGIPVSWAVYYRLVRSGDVSKVVSFTFLVPVLAVILGFLFLNEPVTIALLVGLVLIAVSIYLVNKAPARVEPADASESLRA